MPDATGAVDLSSLNPSFDGLSDKDKADLAALGEERGTQPDAQPVEAMFLVVIPRHGHGVAIRDAADAEKFAGRPATVDEMRYACARVVQDIDDTRTAQAVAVQGLQMQAAMQRASEDAAIRQQLKI